MVCVVVCSFVCLFVCLSVCLFVCLLACLFVRSFVYLFVCLFIYLFVCLFVRPSVRPFVCLLLVEVVVVVVAVVVVFRGCRGCRRRHQSLGKADVEEFEQSTVAACRGVRRIAILAWLRISRHVLSGTLKSRLYRRRPRLWCRPLSFFFFFLHILSS